MPGSKKGRNRIRRGIPISSGTALEAVAKDETKVAENRDVSSTSPSFIRNSAWSCGALWSPALSGSLRQVPVLSRCVLNDTPSALNVVPIATHPIRGRLHITLVFTAFSAGAAHPVPFLFRWAPPVRIRVLPIYPRATYIMSRFPNADRMMPFIQSTARTNPAPRAPIRAPPIPQLRFTRHPPKNPSTRHPSHPAPQSAQRTPTDSRAPSSAPRRVPPIRFRGPPT